MIVEWFGRDGFNRNGNQKITVVLSTAGDYWAVHFLHQYKPDGDLLCKWKIYLK